MDRLISLQAAIDAMMRLEKEDDEMYGCSIPEGFDVKRAKEALEKLPSAQPDIIYCKDCRKHNVNAGYKEDCCPLYEWRGVSYGHEHDYQYCCHAERRTDGVDS